jgi:hypothetical protein
MRIKKCFTIISLWIMMASLSAQSVSELTREGNTWTTNINGTAVYTGTVFADALQKAVDDMGAGVINVRNSAILTKRIVLKANQALDFHSNEINSSGNFRGYHVNGVTIRNLHMTGSPLHSLSFHGCSDIHLHNIRLDFTEPSGGIRIDNDRYAILVETKNLKVTGEIYIKNTRGHAFETYGIDGIEIEQIEAHNTVGCGLLLNESKNAVIGTVVGTYNNQGGGYATFRVANNNGPNIKVESVYSRYSGRGFFSVSGSGGCVIQHVDIANSSNQGILLQDAYDTFVMSGTVSGKIQFVRAGSCGVYVNGDVPPESEKLIGDGTFFKELYVFETNSYEAWGIKSDLQHGDVVYGDREFTFANIPAVLQGCEWIQTAMNARSVTNLNQYATLEVIKSGYLYVAHPDRATEKPNWLQSYGLTDLHVVVQENETTARNLTIYRKKIQVGEKINLGINSTNGTTNSFMYFVMFSEEEHGELQKVELGSGDYFKNVGVFESVNAANWAVKSNLLEGQTVFGDRTFTFASIPAGLQGKEWIQTAMNSRVYTSFESYAEFNVDIDGFIYVAHSDRVSEKPLWLQGYTLTDMKIVVQENATTQRFLSVYKKSVFAGDVVRTGINSNSGTTQSLMYLVIFSENLASSLADKDSGLSFGLSPNPFSEVSNLVFNLQNSSNVEINIYTLNGNIVNSVFKGFKSAGSHSVSINASNLSAGIYIITLKINDNQIVHQKAIIR